MESGTLGRYRIVRELGRGAMGRVFLAHDPQIDRPVAIKTIQIFSSLPEADRAQARERFLREARVAGRLLHPGIVTIFDVGEAAGIPYLAMEYVEGVSLDNFCKPDDLLDPPTVVALIAGAAEALAYAHGAGVVHRDIKPANLMRIGSRDVKIMDFGLAKTHATQLTNDGSLLGTPNYMAPEQVRGGAVDGRSDLWALAVVLYEMLTGEKPFSGDSVSSVLFRIVNEEPRDIGAHLHRVPPVLAGFLATALAKDPGGRFPDGTRFAAALREAARGLGEPPRGESASASKPKPKAKRAAAVAAPVARRPLWPYVVGAAGVVAVGVGALVLLHGRGAEPAPVPETEIAVRTEPPGSTVELDGKPVEGGHVRVAATGPFGTLSSTKGCRTASHVLGPADAGREVVLVFDPESAAIPVDAGADGAIVRLNGEEIGRSPATLTLDLCRENRVETSAFGFTPVAVVVPAGATPLEATRALGGLRMTPAPTGRLVLPATPVAVTFLVDGKAMAPQKGGIELPEGSHELRAVNEAAWVDARTTVEVPAGGSVDAKLAVPPLGNLRVQAFPPNAKVYLRRSGSSGWTYVDDVPLERSIAAGAYDVRVEFAPTGETRQSHVTLRPGDNPPLRFAFDVKH